MATVSDKKRRVEKLLGSKIYQIFIDRFAGCRENYTIDDLKREFIGGNLMSLMNKLDYIKSMNFNVIWLTPFYVNQPNGNHGYHAIDYNHVDQRFAFGNEEEKRQKENIGDLSDSNDVNVETKADLVLKELVKACHAKGLKVMMDFVPNHCHEQHPFFKKAKANTGYRDWFYFTGDGDNQTYLKFLDIGELPKLNLSNPEVRTYLIESTKKFLSYGIDAVRVDHCIGPKKEDLNEIIKEIHKTYPDVPFIGEILPFGCQHAPESVFGISKEELMLFKEDNLEAIHHLDGVFLSYYDILDGVLDFSFQYFVDKFVSGALTEEQCRQKLINHFDKYKDKNYLLLKNIDSHDCDRIMFRCHNNPQILHKALELLYDNYSGRNDPVVIYYGTEDFMTQDDTIRRGSYGDYRCRQPMKFIYEKHHSFFN